MNVVRVRTAGPNDIYTIARVQYQAFGRVASQFDITPSQLPPLMETTEHLTDLHERGTVFLVAESAGEVVGSVRATPRDGYVEIGRLVVADGHVRQGIGTALMDAIEASFAAGTRFELFTGADARGPLELYVRRGYSFLRLDASGPVELVWLEKRGCCALRWSRLPAMRRVAHASPDGRGPSRRTGALTRHRQESTRTHVR